MTKNGERAVRLPSERWAPEESWATVQHRAELYSMGDESVRRRASGGTWPSHR